MRGRERDIQGITEHAPCQGGTAPVKPCGHNHLSRRTSLSLSIFFSLYLRGSSSAVSLRLLIEFSLPHHYPSLHPPILFFLFQIVSTFSILRCEIHFDRRAENRVELVVYSAWFSLPLFFFLHFFSSVCFSLSRICLSCFAEGRKPLWAGPASVILSLNECVCVRERKKKRGGERGWPQTACSAKQIQPLVKSL